VQVLDMGTGSGAIALAIAHERPDWQVTATDASDAALAVAAANAQELGLALRLLPGHWFDALPAGEHFDLILSNPPYVCANDPHLARGDVAHEPPSALAAGADGLDDLRRIATLAPDWLTSGGWLAVEHGWEQGEAVRSLLIAAGFRQVATRRDLGERDRVTLGQQS
jgi:release factor glutamine methyltransferase